MDLHVASAGALSMLALLNALHDVDLQGVHVRSLILALRTTEVGRLFWGASSLVGQRQMEGVVGCYKQ